MHLSDSFPKQSLLRENGSQVTRLNSLEQGVARWLRTCLPDTRSWGRSLGTKTNIAGALTSFKAIRSGAGLLKPHTVILLHRSFPALSNALCIFLTSRDALKHRLQLRCCPVKESRSVLVQAKTCSCLCPILWVTTQFVTSYLYIIPWEIQEQTETNL